MTLKADLQPLISFISSPLEFSGSSNVIAYLVNMSQEIPVLDHIIRKQNEKMNNIRSHICEIQIDLETLCFYYLLVRNLFIESPDLVNSFKLCISKNANSYTVTSNTYFPFSNNMIQIKSRIHDCHSFLSQEHPLGDLDLDRLEEISNAIQVISDDYKREVDQIVSDTNSSKFNDEGKFIKTNLGSINIRCEYTNNQKDVFSFISKMLSEEPNQKSSHLIQQTLYCISYLNYLEQSISNLIMESKAEKPMNGESLSLKMLFQSPYITNLIIRINIRKQLALLKETEDVEIAKDLNTQLKNLTKEINYFVKYHRLALSDLKRINISLASQIELQKNEFEQLHSIMKERAEFISRILDTHREPLDDSEFLQTLAEALEMLVKTHQISLDFAQKVQQKYAEISKTFHDIILQGRRIAYKYRTIIGATAFKTGDEELRTSYFKYNSKIRQEIFHKLQKLLKTFDDSLCGKQNCEVNSNIKISPNSEISSEKDEQNHTIYYSQKWCSSLQKIQQKVQEIEEKKEKIDQEIKKKLKFSNDAMELKQTNIDLLINEIHKVDFELAKERKLKEIFKEKNFFIHNFENLSQKNTPEIHEPSYSHYLQKIMCPICNKQKRNILILTCGHAFCKKCLENHICPICSQPFPEKAITNLCL